MPRCARNAAKIRPLGAYVAVAVLASLVAAAILGWVMTPATVQRQFTTVQLLTLIFFLIIMVGMALGIGLSYVRADQTGLRIRNGIKTPTYHLVPPGYMSTRSFQHVVGSGSHGAVNMWEMSYDQLIEEK